MTVQKGTLYLCATPIGNLDDITLRVLMVLKECDLIAAEDTRHTRKLLSHFDIHTSLTAYHAHNEQQRGSQLVAKLKQGRSVALVSDAGLPGISDPGVELVQLALQHDIPVVPLPGASAGITALVASGLPAARFVFEGFLPAGKKNRRRRLEKLLNETRTMIIYESPHRLVSALEDSYKILGERLVAVARELTKKHEEIYRGMLSGAIDYFKEKQPLGEFTLILAGAVAEKASASTDVMLPGDVLDHVHELVYSGMDKKQAIKEVARLRQIPKREVYAMVNVT
ncbi:MAG: 16S rRNA (cytidine(1402)-2'-O)-methyltransferase [Desulfotomaculum sp.]|nr:16S rRNA (cytidine(1402)-2'-O)-methyltransferase [Desulfotomaculum sp.]MCL0081432.1 16S rRNA (cytidine(1402)-2'-O)-methyltransferase [Peptococcaceae bacterium]